MKEPRWKRVHPEELGAAAREVAGVDHALEQPLRGDPARLGDESEPDMPEGNDRERGDRRGGGAADPHAG